MARGLCSTRSQAESWIRLGEVLVNGKPESKPGFFVAETDNIELVAKEKYVSRAGLKLASVAKALKLDFRNKIILDVGSSTGGFTDYSLQHGAKKVYAVDVGTDQLHPSLRANEKVELHEKTDIRDFICPETPDIILVDVSFISVRQIIEHLVSQMGRETSLVIMLKPQFEAGRKQLTSSGVIKNDRVRREILQDFEYWVKMHLVIVDKSDSSVAGEKGNLEKFYLLKK